MQKNIDATWYIDEQLDFDKKLIYYRYKTIKEYFKGKRALELGSADGQMTKYLVNDFEQLISVDGSKELLDLIPFYNNHTKIHSLFEEYVPDEKFDTIIMEHVLEHVDFPVDLLLRAKEWLSADGIIVIGVPNAFSIHRLVAVKMGLLKTPFELNERDYSLGHQRVYCFDTITEDINKAGLEILYGGGVFFKPLSNGQIEEHWNKEMQEGFYELGKDFPENAAEIYLICSK